MAKDNKKIIDSKRIIKEEKKKIRLERKNIRIKKRDKFKKTKFGKFLGKFIYVFSDDKNSYSFSEVFVITLVSLVVGIFACFSVFIIFSGGRNYFKLSKQLDKFYDTYEVLIDNYYGDVDKNELIEAAINGMVSSVGDVYTSYADIDTTNEFDQLVNGVYEGIGCVIQQFEERLEIVEIYNGSPAFAAGLKVGDLIKTVDEIDAVSAGATKVSEYIKNEATGEIKIVVIRDNNEMNFTLKRERVEIPAVKSDIYERNGKKVGYLGISIFSSVSSKQFKNALDDLEDKGIDSLVIDVRDNNGGYLTAVTDILSSLLSKGEIIYQVQKGDEKEIAKDKTILKREYPIAVLTNGNSASASEILAAAIKESYNGFVVGTKTYGKGTVQQVKRLSDGSMIKYTVENWLTPDGNWINEVGIEPTHEVILDDVYYNEPVVDNDNQLQKAIDLVSN